MKLIVITPEADAAAISVFKGYSLIRPELGQRFRMAFERALNEIQEFPEAFPKVLEPARKIRLRKFPYNVFYEYDGDKIVVWQVFHSSRDLEQLVDLEKIPKDNG